VSAWIKISKAMSAEGRNKLLASGQSVLALRPLFTDPSEMLIGIGKGRLIDVGPIILGHRF